MVDVDNPDLSKFPDFSSARSIDFTLNPGEVLYIPALWFHNVRSEEFSVSVNSFFRHLPLEFYDRKDLYCNRDPPLVQESSRLLDQIIDRMDQLPDDFREFYMKRFSRRLTFSTT